MTLGEHQQAFSRDVFHLMQFVYSKGYDIRIGEAQRPIEMQELYVKTGRSKTLDSMHIKKCAIDLHFTKDGQLCYPEEIGVYWESLNPLNQWGGHWKSFKDQPHFQRTVK